MFDKAKEALEGKRYQQTQGKAESQNQDHHESFLDQVGKTLKGETEFQKKAKEKSEQARERFAEAREKANNKLTTNYMGGYGSYRKALGELNFFDDHIEFRLPLHKESYFEIDKASIADVTFEGKDEVFQQRTITRNLLLFGKSKTKEIKEAYHCHAGRRPRSDVLCQGCATYGAKGQILKSGISS